MTLRVVIAYEHGIESIVSPKKKFARNIEYILTDNIENRKDRVHFWESIAFHELVQRPLTTKNERPKQSDYDIGAKVLSQIIEVVKPRICIFLGTTWSKYESLKSKLYLTRKALSKTQ
ncbi:MAG: hypothetical protein GDA42_07320 [Ekhidna sp.]|nr:hypothetical protein [Ekhidna sp.]